MQPRTIVAAYAIGAFIACSSSKTAPKDAKLAGDGAPTTLDSGVPDAAAPDSGAADAAALANGDGPDAPVAPIDGGLYPPIFIVPAAAIVAHSPLVGAQPDLTVRLEQVWDPFFVDLDGDGLRDVVFSDGGKTLSCSLQDKTGSFRAIHGIAVGANYLFDRVTFGDLDADGLTDIVLVRYPDEHGWYHAELAVYLQTSDGFRDEPDATMVPVQPGSAACVRTYAASVDDMNGDGRPDIVALTAIDDSATAPYGCSYGRGIAQIFIQSADGGFSATTELSPRSAQATCGTCAVSFATGDLDGDGQKDLVVLEDPAGNGSGIPLHGHQVLVYPQEAGGFGGAPTQVLTMGQYLRIVELADLDRDGRLDILTRPGEWAKYEGRIDLSDTIPGLSGAFLQKSDGTFDAARALVLDDPPTDAMAASARRPIFDPWMPAGANRKSDPLGIAVRDIDGDGAADLLVECKSVAEGLFRQELGLFATTPDLEVQSLFPALLSAAKKSTTITFSATSTSIEVTFCDNHLAYRVTDMDGDGRDDVVVAFSPCAPNLSPDPVTGWYPRDGFKPNTYTELQVYRQRVPARHFVVEVQQSTVAPEQRLLEIRATVRNLSDQPASDVRMRVQAAEVPVLFSYTIDMLATRFDEMAAYASRSILESERTIHGDSLAPDILVPRIGPRETVPLAIDIPVALVKSLQAYALFVLVDPDQNTNLLYRRKFAFIAAP
jgi:hypothetical protein